jgi:hypothetical protein
MISLGKFLQLLRDSLSVSQPLRGLSNSPSTLSSSTFYSGPVLYKFFEILSLVLSSNQNNISCFQFLFSTGEPPALFLFLSTYPQSHAPCGLGLLTSLPSCVFLHAFLLLMKVLDMSCSFCQKETQVSLGL